MAEMCTQSYLDNDLLCLSGHQLANQLFVHVEDSLHTLKVNVKVYGWAKVLQFKQQILALPQFQGLTLSEVKLFYKNIQLSDDRKTLQDYKLSNGSIIVIERRNKIQLGSKGVINPYKLFEKSNQKVGELIRESIQAINNGVVPSLTSEGTSGVYIIENKNKQNISIFKPFDQEVHAPNNPRNMTGKLGSDGISKGILSGQCATRQVAAYLLDNEGHNFHGVPTTTYVQFYHPSFIHKQFVQQTPIASSQEIKLNVGATKHGSLQQFVSSSGIIGDYGSSRFSNEQIHKIAILDIRILNCDRNQQNILVQQEGKNKYKLIPIDHGLSFPDNLQIYQQTVLWMGFPQSKKPFSESQLKFIQEINPAKDAQMLVSKLGFRQICLRNFRISQIFLKKAASLGFNLYEMGKMLYRTQQYDQQLNENIKTKRSAIENVVMQAQNLYLNSLEQIQKQNLDPKQNQDLKQEDFELDQIEEESDDSNTRCSGTSNSTSTCDSIKNILQLKRKVSLPQLKRKGTSFHELRQKARKQREGVNGVSKTIWNKYHQQQWNQLFYHYFQNLLDTMLLEKSMAKTRKLSSRSESAK